MGKGGRGVSKFALVVSAVSASSWRFSKSRTGNLHRVCQASAAVEHPEILAVREGIQRPCGSEERKYRRRCQGVQVSDGLGGQRFKLAISRPRDATNNKQQQPFFSYLPSTSSGSSIPVAVAGSGTFAASHSERGAIEREAFESFLEPVAGGCLASC